MVDLNHLLFKRKPSIKELKDLINEVLDERQLQISNTTVTSQDYSYNLFDQDLSINTEGTDVITFT